MSGMRNRAGDPLRQSERDLEVARTTLNASQFDWSCFAAQQAAEKALKALYQAHNAEGWGHSIDRLIAGLLVDEPGLAAFEEAGRILDKHYIPTRYPNGLDRGAPADSYTATEARAAIGYAEQIIQYCQARCTGQA